MSTKISTGRVSDSFEVIDTIFAIDSHKEGFWFGSADPNKAFEGVKQVLRKKCEQLGGDAIQDCQFEYRVAIADGILKKVGDGNFRIRNSCKIEVISVVEGLFNPLMFCWIPTCTSVPSTESLSKLS